MTIFASMSEFLGAVRLSAINKRIDDRILAAAPSTAGSEAVGADGGFAVPATFASEILGLVREQSLAGRCSIIQTASNNVSLAVDEAAPWADTTFTWETELATLGENKPAFQGRSFRLAKIVGLIPVSDELLEDAPGLDAYMRTVVPQKIAAKLNAAIIRGTGAGQPLGILNSGCLITVSRGGSVAATAASMWQRLPGESQQRAVWLHNPSVAIPTTPGLPLLLHGAPCLGIEACSQAGALGDLILADLAAYQLIMRTLKIDTSMHCYFDADAMAYRFTLRVQGNPLWSAAAQPLFGSDTRSPFVTVAA